MAWGIEGLCANNVSDGVEEPEAFVAVDWNEGHTAIDLFLRSINVNNEGWSAVLLKKLNDTNLLESIWRSWEVIARAFITSLAGVEVIIMVVLAAVKLCILSVFGVTDSVPWLASSG